MLPSQFPLLFHCDWFCLREMVTGRWSYIPFSSSHLLPSRDSIKILSSSIYAACIPFEFTSGGHEGTTWKDNRHKFWCHHHYCSQTLTITIMCLLSVNLVFNLVSFLIIPLGFSSTLGDFMLQGLIFIKTNIYYFFIFVWIVFIWRCHDSCLVVLFLFMFSLINVCCIYRSLPHLIFATVLQKVT